MFKILNPMSKLLYVLAATDTAVTKLRSQLEVLLRPEPPKSVASGSRWSVLLTTEIVKENQHLVMTLDHEEVIPFRVPCPHLSRITVSSGQRPSISNCRRVT